MNCIITVYYTIQKMGCDYIFQPMVELTYKDESPPLQFIDFAGAIPMYMYDNVEDDFYGEMDRRINEWKTTCPVVTIYDNGAWNCETKNGEYVYRKDDHNVNYVYVSPVSQGIAIGYTKERILELISFTEIDKVATIKILPDAERR
jgi:hypothetical protein